MNQPIFSQSTVVICRECVIQAENKHGFLLKEALAAAGVSEADLSDPERARHAFDGLLKAVNWTDPRSVSGIVPIFAAAYAETPKGPMSVHQEIDVAMARDGFQIRDRNLERLAL